MTTINPLSLEEWEATHGRLYRAAIAAGVKSVMSAHIAFPAFVRSLLPDAGVEAFRPASVSRILNQVLLRERLGFNGLIVSYASPMAGFGSWAPRSQMLPEVIENGCDLILFSPDPEGDLALVTAAIADGRICAARLEAALLRVLGLVEQGQPLIGIVESINFVLVNSLPLGRFVAAALVCLDEGRRQGEVWVGGIPDVMLIDTAHQYVRRFDSRCLPLGVSREADAIGSVESFTWDSPARLVMLSDGVVEATSASGEAFGEARLLEALTHTHTQDDDLIGSLHAALNAHLKGAAAHDDMSVLVIGCPATP